MRLRGNLFIDVEKSLLVDLSYLINISIFAQLLSQILFYARNRLE